VNDLEKYVTENRLVPGDYSILEKTASQAYANMPDGLFLEFGVCSGHTINRISGAVPEADVFGFDSFNGLPEKWRDFPQGYFNVDTLPKVNDNVKLIVGLFQDTLQNFIDQYNKPIAFCHIDCDLYSSTKYVLTVLKNNFVDGSIISFDELGFYQGYEEHEYRAFNEFLEETGFKLEYLGKSHIEAWTFKLVR